MMADFYWDLKAWLEETRDVPLEEMGSFFDTRIGDYEEHMSPWKEHYSWMAQLLPAEIRTLLDIGCGTGLELDQIFLRFPSLLVTGIDLSHEMLTRLSEKHAGRFLFLIQANYFSYDFPKDAFDSVVAFETLHHFTAEQKQTLFTKLHRTLRSGGVFLECDYIATTQEIEDLLFTECRRRRDRDGIPPDKFVHFDTPLTLEHEMQAIREGGFERVELVGFLACDDHTAMIRAVK